MISTLLLPMLFVVDGWRKPTATEDPDSTLNYLNADEGVALIITVPDYCPTTTITEPNWYAAHTWQKTVQPVDVPGGPRLEDPPAPFSSKSTPVQDHSFTVVYEDSGYPIPKDHQLDVFYHYTFDVGQETWLYESGGFLVGFDSRERNWFSPGVRLNITRRRRAPLPGGGSGGGDPQ